MISIILLVESILVPALIIVSHDHHCLPLLLMHFNTHFGWHLPLTKECVSTVYKFASLYHVCIILLLQFHLFCPFAHSSSCCARAFSFLALTSAFCCHHMRHRTHRATATLSFWYAFQCIVLMPAIAHLILIVVHFPFGVCSTLSLSHYHTGSPSSGVDRVSGRSWEHILHHTRRSAADTRSRPGAHVHTDTDIQRQAHTYTHNLSQESYALLKAEGRLTNPQREREKRTGERAQNQREKRGEQKGRKRHVRSHILPDLEAQRGTQTGMLENTQTDTQTEAGVGTRRLAAMQRNTMRAHLATMQLAQRKQYWTSVVTQGNRTMISATSGMRACVFPCSVFAYWSMWLYWAVWGSACWFIVVCVP